jgi:hypothetical protein
MTFWEHDKIREIHCRHSVLHVIIKAKPTLGLDERVRVRESELHYNWQSVSKSWCRAQSGTFDQKFFFLSYCPVIWGRPLWREVGSVIYQSLSIQSRVVSHYLHKLFTVCVKHRSYLQYLTLIIYIGNTIKYNVQYTQASVSSGFVQQIMP